MGSFNAIAAVVDTLKTWPEPVSLPESLMDASPVQLAEARNRLQQISQCANELRRTVDVLLASHLDGGGLRYGESFLRPAYRGRPYVTDQAGWWEEIWRHVQTVDDPVAFLASLYPADSVRLTALPDGLRDTFIDYRPATSTIDVLPLSRAPMWAQQLEEGQVGSR